MEGNRAVAGGVVAMVQAVLARLASLPDARAARGKRYPLAPLLLLILLAKLAGEDRPRGIADWLAHRATVLHATLGLAWRRMPHHNTLRRVLAVAVLPDDLDALVGALFRAQAAVGQQRQISIDGKTVWSSSGDIIDARTKKVLAGLTDDNGRQVQSEKLLEIVVDNGKVVAAGNQFGIGQKR